ncbi:MAG: hypothetical protein J7M18_01180 [Candidatus Eremiobacteraeota bacterium]|nr:hypothetical protein [Candidatus Eremiobacteraeota bacterium]
MVRKIFLLILIVILPGIVTPGIAMAGYSFELPEAKAVVTAKEDGSADIEYWFTFENDAGAQPIDVVDVGFPNNYCKVSSVYAEQDGRDIKNIKKSTYIDNGVEIHLPRPIPPGEKGNLYVRFPANRMIWQDDKDKEYASIEFSPTWFDGSLLKGTTARTVQIIMPPGVKPDEPRYHRQKFTSADVYNDTVRYTWYDPSARFDKKYLVGASFPKKYVEKVYERPKINIFKALFSVIFKNLDFLFSILLNPVTIIILVIVIAYYKQRKRRMKYLPPTIGVEGVGIKTGLTAPLAALLLEVPLNKVVTMIMFGLIKKGFIKIKKTEPLVLEKLKTEKEPDYDYEKDFLKAIDDLGMVNELRARAMMIDMIKDLKERMRGFSLKETISYYRQIVSDAWKQVETADTPELKYQLYDDDFEWVILSDDFGHRTREVFADTYVYPRWWPKYEHTGPVYAPAHTSSGDSGGYSPSPGIEIPRMAGADFASGIVSWFETTSNSVVGKAESFISSVTEVTNPVPVSSGSGFSGGGSGCACACAGCACACAGGGR